MITLNPLVQSHRRISSHASSELAQKQSTIENEYEITDIISYLPYHLWDSTVTYTAKFTCTVDGLDTLVAAPAGVLIEGAWRIIGIGDEGGQTLQETAKVTCNWALMPFVKVPMHSSHKILHERFLEILKERQNRHEGAGG